MMIGVLQVELYIPDAMTLKDKRRVVNSVKDKLHREHQVSVAEVDQNEIHNLAVLGLACVSNSKRHVQGVLDRIVDQLRNNRKFVLNDYQAEVISSH